nr:unnamed protein product [Digitaria exilis]
MFKIIDRQPDIDIYDTKGIILADIKGDVELKDVYFSYPTRPEHLGLDTMVGERGVQLSGGQKQRIAIARAIVKNPKVLLLDEATSALDMESERAVQEALNRAMLERTTVIVAHRLSTVKNADVISVLQNGKMVEQGSHVELMKIPGGSYSKLVHLQGTQGKTESSHVDYNMIATDGSGSRSIHTKPRSKSFSKRSVSKGSSSGGHSNRHSFSTSPRQPDPTEFNPASNIEEDTTHKVMPIGPKKASIARLFCLNKPEAVVLALGSIIAAMHGTVMPLFGTLISTAIKTFYEPPEKLPKDSRFWAIMFVALGAYCFALTPVEYFLFGLAGGKLVERIRSLMFQSVMRQDINWFDKPEHSRSIPIKSFNSCYSGLIGARLSINALFVKRLVGDNLALNVQNLSTAISGLTIAMVANWKLTLIITVVVPFVGFQAYAQMLFLNGLTKNAKWHHPCLQTVALVGESGSGKSTVIALLERFYDPDSGKILFDNVDLQTLKVSWLRQQIGLVAQEPVLFNDTIRTNIAYGRQGEASEEEIVAAAESANAHEFISALPDGYSTIVGERGIQLSGGQKQRVAIARAIIKNPKVLLLDEATSALDVESERVVQEALDNVVVGRTTVVVAHRLSTIRGADTIAVLKNGTVVETGRHGELMRIEDGIYASLVELSCSSA